MTLFLDISKMGSMHFITSPKILDIVVVKSLDYLIKL